MPGGGGGGETVCDWPTCLTTISSSPPTTPDHVLGLGKKTKNTENTVHNTTGGICQCHCYTFPSSNVDFNRVYVIVLDECEGSVREGNKQI